jgi:hypothetical protein
MRSRFFDRVDTRQGQWNIVVGFPWGVVLNAERGRLGVLVRIVVEIMESIRSDVAAGSLTLRLGNRDHVTSQFDAVLKGVRAKSEFAVGSALQESMTRDTSAEP